jgi:hypothetical protein
MPSIEVSTVLKIRRNGKELWRVIKGKLRNSYFAHPFTVITDSLNK